jgi:hypothetical protein
MLHTRLWTNLMNGTRGSWRSHMSRMRGIRRLDCQNAGRFACLEAGSGLFCVLVSPTVTRHPAIRRNRHIINVYNLLHFAHRLCVVCLVYSCLLGRKCLQRKGFQEKNAKNLTVMQESGIAKKNLKTRYGHKSDASIDLWILGGL